MKSRTYFTTPCKNSSSECTLYAHIVNPDQIVGSDCAAVLADLALYWWHKTLHAICVFGHMRTVKAQTRLPSQPDQGLLCLLTESWDTIECVYGEKVLG